MDPPYTPHAPQTPPKPQKFHLPSLSCGPIPLQDWTWKRLFLFSLSCTLAVLGAFMFLFSERIFQSILNSQIRIVEGTPVYSAWLETPFPTYTSYYFFTVLNTEEFLEHKAKPILKELGPYTFRESSRKVNITHNSNGTVTYRREKFWYFEPSKSIGSLSDQVTTINIPMVGAAAFVKGDYMMEYGLSDTLAALEAPLFITKTAGELLFEGYTDPLMDMVSSLSSEQLEEEDEEFGDDWMSPRRKRNAQYPLDKFGWFYKRNGTSWADGWLSMYTGEVELDTLGRLVQWEHMERTGVFPGECGQVRGSADGLFAPGVIQNSNNLEIFSTDICRTLMFERDGSATFHNITVDKFTLSPTVFSNTSVCPDNWCYENNLRSGVQNLTECKVRSATFVSRPHFYQADSFYREQFQAGIQPREDKHESRLWLEPQSSIPVEVEIRLQLNILLESIPGMQHVFRELPTVMFPTMWFESMVSLPEDMTDLFHLLHSLPIMIQVCSISNFTIGILSLVLSVRGSVTTQHTNVGLIKPQ